MLVEIEGYKTEAIVWGKKCSIKELRNKMFKTLEQDPSQENFTALFCCMWNFEEIPHTEIEVDFVIDTDIHHIYKPKY